MVGAFRITSSIVFEAVATACSRRAMDIFGKMWALFFEDINGQMTSSHILVNLVGHGNPEAKD